MSDAQIREWDSALTRCAALLVRSSYRDDISDEDADMLRDAVSRATRARDGLITRLRAAEARIERVGAILSDEGCDCYCDCDSDGHNADCDLCLACRIDREVSP